MKTTLYEILLVPPDADEPLLQHAYEQSLATLAKRLRAARQRGLETTGLEEERLGLGEAWRVLSDPVRRAHYDRFLQLVGEQPAQEADELWARVSVSLLDPAAEATLDLVRLLTGLPVGDAPPRPSPAPAPPPPPAAAAVVQSVAKPVVAPRPKKPAPPAGTEPTPGPRPTASSSGSSAIGGDGPSPKRAQLGDDLPTMIFELGYSGALICQIRENKGLSLDDVASSTRIAKRYLEAIEEDAFSRLPAATFVRGYLRSLGRLLGVDPERLSGGYLARMGR